MVLNNKGSAFGVMMFVMVFICAVILTAPLRSFIDTARDSSHLDCDATGNTLGVTLTCIIVDLTLFFFIGALIAGGISLMSKQTGG